MIERLRDFFADAGAMLSAISDAEQDGAPAEKSDRARTSDLRGTP